MLDPNVYNKGKNDGDRLAKGGSTTIYKDPLDVMPEARRAKCTYCSNTSLSNEELPFFSRKDGESLDAYYCGCYGWD